MYGENTLGVCSFGLIFVSAKTNKKHHHPGRVSYNVCVCVRDCVCMRACGWCACVYVVYVFARACIKQALLNSLGLLPEEKQHLLITCLSLTYHSARLAPADRHIQGGGRQLLVLRRPQQHFLARRERFVLPLPHSRFLARWEPCVLV